MTATTLRRWMEFDELSPFGDQRADLRMSIEAAAIVTSLSGKRQKTEDYMPRFRRPRQSLDHMKRVMQQFASATDRYFDGGH